MNYETGILFQDIAAVVPDDELMDCYIRINNNGMYRFSFFPLELMLQIDVCHVVGLFPSPLDNRLVFAIVCSEQLEEILTKTYLATLS